MRGMCDQFPGRSGQVWHRKTEWRSALASVSRSAPGLPAVLTRSTYQRGPADDGRAPSAVGRRDAVVIQVLKHARSRGVLLPHGPQVAFKQLSPIWDRNI